MLNENLKQLRKSKGLTQEEFALQLGVVRQTISKWEKGLSVPDSEMLIEISERFDVPVSTLLGDTIEPAEKEDLIKIMSDKLALINEQLANAAERKRRITRSLSFAGIAVAACYLAWQAIIMIHAYVQPFSPENASASVIGGADGPTSIFVYNSGLSVTGMIIIAVILIVSIAYLVDATYNPFLYFRIMEFCASTPLSNFTQEESVSSTSSPKTMLAKFSG